MLAYEDRLTTRGRYLLWMTAAFALAGLDTSRTQVFVLFAAAAGVLVPALALGFRRPPSTLLACVLPARATAGRPVRLRARASFPGRTGELSLSFPRPLRWGRGLRFTPSVTFLAPREDGTAEAAVELHPLRRGRYELRAPALRHVDPLRLVAGRARKAPDQALLVYPRFYHLEAFDLPLARRYQPGGIPLASSTGEGAIEFVGTRDYREGDPIKNIHWRSWARRGEPVVKEYQEEYFSRLALILDTFLPPRPKEADLRSFEAGISVLASVADHFSRSDHVVDILAAGPDLYEVSAGRSLAYLDNILDVLACLEPCPEPPFATVGPPLFEKLGRLSAVVAVVLDWDPPRSEFLERLRGLGPSLHVIVVREGETREDWRGAAVFGGAERVTPAEVERRIAASQPRGAGASHG